MFDASQYAFFGNDVVEEVELGGLEDDDETEYLPALEFDNEAHQLDTEEVWFIKCVLVYCFITYTIVIYMILYHICIHNLDLINHLFTFKCTDLFNYI